VAPTVSGHTLQICYVERELHQGKNPEEIKSTNWHLLCLYTYDSSYAVLVSN